ncbi:MAG: hypothetical protein ACXWT4_15380 [Methylobacter sp.]
MFRIIKLFQAQLVEIVVTRDAAAFEIAVMYGEGNICPIQVNH